jgi:hypothetical protein
MGKVIVELSGSVFLPLHSYQLFLSLARSLTLFRSPLPLDLLYRPTLACSLPPSLVLSLSISRCLFLPPFRSPFSNGQTQYPQPQPCKRRLFTLACVQACICANTVRAQRMVATQRRAQRSNKTNGGHWLMKMGALYLVRMARPLGYAVAPTNSLFPIVYSMSNAYRNEARDTGKTSRSQKFHKSFDREDGLCRAAHLV